MKTPAALAACLWLAASVFSATAAEIYLAGDSTMSNYPAKRAPQQGWGRALPDLCAEGVKVNNLAIGGRSVKSFRAEGRWEKLLERIGEGDFVVIQFGHNDGNKKAAERYTNHRSEFPELLKACVAEVREKKAHPVLVTLTARWAFDETGQKIRNGTPSAYAKATRAVAESENVPLVDLNAIAIEKLVAIGPDDTKKFYMVSSNGKDTLHLTEDGAKAYAEWFVEAVKEQELPLASLLK